MDDVDFATFMSEDLDASVMRSDWAREMPLQLLPDGRSFDQFLFCLSAQSQIDLYHYHGSRESQSPQ